MPNYDVRCPNCGDYERFKRIDDRHSACDTCGAEIEIRYTSSVEHRPFKPYFDICLGEQITSNHQRNQVARRLDAQPRDGKRKGDISAYIDRAHERRKEAARG